MYEDKHSEDSKPDSAHEKPLAPRVILGTNILQIINFSYDDGCRRHEHVLVAVAQRKDNTIHRATVFIQIKAAS